MAFNDLEYGWSTLWFLLKDVEVYRALELQQKNEDGWIAAHHLVVVAEDSDEEGVEQFGVRHESDETRYGFVRSLNAKAFFGLDNYDVMHLGVPEDKKWSPVAHEDRLESIQLIFYEKEHEKDRGRIQYLGRLDPPVVYINLAITSEMFDDIESMARQQDGALIAGVNVRGWYWLAPALSYSDKREFYFPVEREGEDVELASFFSRLEREDVFLKSDQELMDMQAQEDIDMQAQEYNPIEVEQPKKSGGKIWVYCILIGLIAAVSIISNT